MKGGRLTLPAVDAPIAGYAQTRRAGSGQATDVGSQGPFVGTLPKTTARVRRHPFSPWIGRSGPRGGYRPTIWTRLPIACPVGNAPLAVSRPAASFQVSTVPPPARR